MNDDLAVEQLTTQELFDLAFPEKLHHLADVGLMILKVGKLQEEWDIILGDIEDAVLVGGEKLAEGYATSLTHIQSPIEELRNLPANHPKLKGARLKARAMVKMLDHRMKRLSRFATMLKSQVEAVQKFS